jgi:hypothetical protein
MKRLLSDSPARRDLWLAGAWSAVMFVGCSMPGVTLPETPWLSADKLAHIGLFAVWAVLWRRVWRGRPWTVAVWGAAFGVWIEVWQSVAPLGRTGDPLDAVADAVGVALGLGVAAVLARRFGGAAPSAPAPR